MATTASRQGPGQHGDRGHTAERPSDIPRAGWLDVLSRVKDGIGRYDLGIVSAGMAFNEFFALFPTLVAAVSIYGLVADPAEVERQMSVVSGFLPPEAQGIVRDQLKGLATVSGGKLGLSLVLSILVALWGATRGVKALISGLNIVYREEEKRGFVRLNAVALGLTLAAIVFGLVALTLIAAVPIVLDFLPLPEWAPSLLSVLRWVLLGVFLLVGLAVVYRYASSRDEPKWRWVSWGAVVAAALWLIGSGLFSLYVANFGKFNETYGSMAAVAVLLLWLQLTGFVVLLGALLDAEMELQTTADTTEGPDAPMGQRGAHVADTAAPRGR